MFTEGEPALAWGELLDALGIQATLWSGNIPG